MKLSLALALILIALPGVADDAASPEKKESGVAVATEKAHPDLLRLERTLTQRVREKKDGRLTADKYREWEARFRSTLAATMARIPPSPDNTAAHARIAAKLGEREQALATLDQALEQTPGSPVLLRTKGRLLYEQNDFLGAARCAFLAWEKSGRADQAAWTLYQMSKGRVSSAGTDAAVPSQTVAPQGTRLAEIQSRPPATEDAPFKLAAKNVLTSLPSPPAPTDAGPISKGSSPPDIAKAAFFAAATATGGLLLFLGFGAQRLEDKFPNIRRNMGIAVGVGGVIAAAAASWPVTQAAIATRLPPAVEAGRRLKDRFAGSFAQVANSESGAINPASERVLQAASTLNNLNIRLAAQEIAGGHAYAKHAAELGAKSPAEFAARIESTMANPTMMRTLSNGRIAYWHQASATVVIRDPSALDGGTAFMARDGVNYFLKLR